MKTPWGNRPIAKDLQYGDYLQKILDDYKEDYDVPLDGDEVDQLVGLLRAQLNLLNGNLTEEEYLAICENMSPEDPAGDGAIKTSRST